jgi:hypothetical protein
MAIAAGRAQETVVAALQDPAHLCWPLPLRQPPQVRALPADVCACVWGLVRKSLSCASGIPPCSSCSDPCLTCVCVNVNVFARAHTHVFR